MSDGSTANVARTFFPEERSRRSTKALCCRSSRATAVVTSAFAMPARRSTRSPNAREMSGRSPIRPRTTRRRRTERIALGCPSVARVIGVGLALRADCRGCVLRRLRRAVGDGLRLLAGLAEEPLDLELHLFAFALRGLRRLQAFADPGRARVERARDRTPHEPLQYVEEHQEIDDGHEHPERVDDERARSAFRRHGSE